MIVTHGFLRSLARLDLEESAVGRFDPRGIREEKDGSVTVGDTPWGVIAALAAAAIAALVALALWLMRRRSARLVARQRPQLLAVVAGRGSGAPCPSASA